MKKKYLLFIDILGFSDLVKKGDDRIINLYKIIDSLNAHKHPDFKTIVFSDTILIFNEPNPDLDNIHDNEYCVMYLIEFAQDLQQRLVGLELFFRAQLRYDYFKHFKLENIECYYGSNLITSYVNESKIPAIGIFIDKHCQKLNIIFPSIKFSSDLYFIFINQSLERFFKVTKDSLPTDRYYLEQAYYFEDILWDIKYLQNIYKGLDSSDPVVRSKYLSTWSIFNERYTKIIDVLKKNDFSIKSLYPNLDWESLENSFKNEIEYYNSL